jgi:hypothetical protein
MAGFCSSQEIWLLVGRFGLVPKGLLAGKFGSGREIQLLAGRLGSWPGDWDLSRKT